MTKQYRTSLSAWIILGTISSAPWLLIWVDWGRRQLLMELALALTFSGLVITWLASYQIAITSTELRFRNFWGWQSIRHDQIKKVWLKSVKNRRGPPTPHLVIEPRPDTDAKEMS